MALNPAFKACRAGRHKRDPVNTDIGEREVYSTCTVCHADLTADIGTWNAVYGEDVDPCAECEEVPAYCTCWTPEAT